MHPLYKNSLLLAASAVACWTGGIGSLEAYSNKTAQNTQAPSGEDDSDLFRKDVQVFSFSGEFLFWRVQESALDYALKMKTPAWGPSESYAQGSYKTATFNGEPGFRVRASFYRAPSKWEMWWQYTRLTSSGTNSVSKPSPSGEYITGTWPQVTTAPLAQASSSIHLNYNLADLAISRVFNPNLHLRLRLMGGGLAVWMNQNWVIQYKDSTPNTTKIGNRWRYIAGGLRIGTFFDWFWSDDFYVTAAATTAIAIGTYQNKAKQMTTFQPNGLDNTSVPIRNAVYEDVRPAFLVQALVGPSWQKGYTNWRLEVFAGYEINTWFNIHEIYRSSGGSPSEAKQTWINSGAIALQGLTTRVTVDF